MIHRITEYQDIVLDQFRKGTMIGEKCGLDFMDANLKIRPGFFYTVTGWPGCFAKGQLVHTQRGVIPINEIVVGDRVLSYDKKRDTNEYRTVINTPVHKSTKQRLFLIKLKDGTELRVTENHEFFTGSKYVKIKDILLALPHGDMEKNT